MHGKQAAMVLGAAFFLVPALCGRTRPPIAADKVAPPQRDALMKAFHAGNFKDAYDGLRKLALDANDDPARVGQDLTTAIACLQRLGRSDEIDDFREAVINAHKGNWRLLETAAESYAGKHMEHFGFIVAGKFQRGSHRGGGRYVATLERDRTRALQLMQQALALNAKDNDKPALARFYLHFARILLNGAGGYESWRLQYLTDLKQIPDYQDGYSRHYGGDHRGAPVDAAGDPIYYRIPKKLETAASDGERWRWMLAQAAEFDPNCVSDIDMQLAHFARLQFGVQTLAQLGQFPSGGRQPPESKTGTFALHTLKDDETIAKLATGMKRFTLPDEFNWITIAQRVAKRGKDQFAEQARDLLAGEYEDRRQYVKAAQAWQTAIAEHGAGQQAFRQRRLDQIVGNWGRFEPQRAASASDGKRAVLDYRFRNGNKVSFEARAITVEKLLDDVKAYLKNNPGQLDWNTINIDNIGYRLVEQNQQQYLGDKVASWEVELKPRPEHIDDRITVTAPMDKAGAYLVTATMQGGNVSRIIVWISDTVILKKQLDGQSYYYVADAVSGAPIAKAEVEFFGWRQQWIGNGSRWRIDTTALQDSTDDDGQILLGRAKMPEAHQWLITARKKKDGKNGGERFAYLGFTGVWYGRTSNAELNAVKVFTITDRPVYRPEQKVQLKAWIAHAKYDQKDSSALANQTFQLRIHNPKGEKVFEQQLKTDDYGGLSGEFSLPRGVALGVYAIQVFDASGKTYHGGGSFRVEEYKKPEFEVAIEAPKEPVRLGEKIKAAVKAKYYFGAPVVRAKVKYKVLRTSYEERWYPSGAWDWLYGRGYWWFAADYPWYPGWNEWGCRRPVPAWWPGRGQEQPEVVLENEVEIGANGIVEIPIDTAAAKELHGDSDHKYSITAEVTDESRRTIVGTGDVLAARKPFQVFAWVDRGHYRAGDAIEARFRAQTLDRKPVQGNGELTLLRIAYPPLPPPGRGGQGGGEPVEKAVQTWKLNTDAEGKAVQQIKAAGTGQYRLSYKLTDAKKHTIEGGYVFLVRGEGFDGRDFRFNDIELVTDKREYQPGDKVQLLLNTNRNDGVVLLFVRPANGVYLPPRLLRLKGKSIAQEVAVVQKDMPNFFIEAVTVANGRVHTDVREVIVPPEKRVLNIEVQPSQKEYLPGQKATVKLKLTDFFGKPFVGSTVLSIYDKSVEYISGGSNVPEIRDFFWKWRRHHYPHTESSLSHYLGELLRHDEIGMANLGVFGATVVEEYRSDKTRKEAVFLSAMNDMEFEKASAGEGGARMGFGGAPAGAAKGMARGANAGDKDATLPARTAPPNEPPPAGPVPTIRKNFADTALWVASLTTDKNGCAEVSLNMPENLTAWKVKVWAMGAGTRVGQADAEIVTKKNLIVRLQAPRFFVQKDEVVLSANVHNYLKSAKSVNVSLEMDGGTLAATGATARTVSIPAGGEQRVDWRVKVIGEGDAVVRMKAVSDEESDAVQMLFPCYVHGMLKTDSFSGVVRAEQKSGGIVFHVPAERRINETRLEVRYSPTLAGAMIDALPYLVDYPYGCTEQTLNRFLPTIITQRVLQNMKLDLKDIQKKRSPHPNPSPRRGEGKGVRGDRNPVFDEEEVRRMVQAGIDRLAAMQCSDGGWGWFSGWGEHSWPHTTALVVHGLQIAKGNNVALPQGMLERGIAWLKNHQAEQAQHLHNASARIHPWKDKADNLDAFVYMVLVDAGALNNDMRAFLYRDRVDLAVYAKIMFGLALQKEQQADKLAMILKNIEQFVVQDKENQTAYLRLPAGNAWWLWHGSEIEADAYYLKLLSRTNPKDPKAAGLVKYLLNNRKHATYWNSTRDTAVCIEAMADYLKASGEDKPDMTVEIWLDGKKHKEVKIDAANLFSFDNKLLLKGDAVDSGKHTLEIRRKGTGPVYFNAYLTNFTLEDFIARAGLEVKVNRKYYNLTRLDAATKVSGARGQSLDQKIEKFKRTELPNLSALKSGDLVEVELEIDSKNDYEYLIFEDPKAAGFEPLLVRSGYSANDLGAYMELRDEKVCFFVRSLARGKHSIAYRLRAEIPGRFSALPARGYAMYAPELRGNSDEIKLAIED
jgi:uncharacterized protein YfaS (alpha-2-macroglobulin family)